MGEETHKFIVIDGMAIFDKIKYTLKMKHVL